MDSHTYLIGKIMQQSLVSRSEFFAMCSWGKYQFTNMLCLVDKWKTNGAILRPIGRSVGSGSSEGVILFHGNSSIRQLESLSNRFYNRGQYRFWCKGGL